MPKYFFHFRRRHIVIRDEIGIELADQQAAIREARSAIALITRDDAGDKNKYHLESVRIEDESGKQLESISLKEGCCRNCP